MSIIQTDLPAVILDCRDHGESDKIVTFFCQEIGKLTGIAKGAHRSKKRFVNKLELFSFLQITYSRSQKGGLALINDADLLNSFIELRTSINRFQAASVIREIVLFATDGQMRDDHLFKLILWALNALDRKQNCESIVALFFVKLFDCIGYRPDFTGCRNCGRSYLGNSPGVLSIQAGGLICSKCMTTGTFIGRHLTAGTIQTFLAIQGQSLEKIERIKLSGTVLKEILDTMYRYSRHMFQRDIHSWAQFSPARQRKPEIKDNNWNVARY